MQESSVRLTKSQRATLREKFGGRCSYCGEPLGDRWHADHLEAVQRKLEHVRGKGFVPTGEAYRPEHDHIGNMMPSCAPCNIDKHVMSLEDWRGKLARTLEVLQRNNPTYRHALRFGMLEEKPAPIIFYFERCGAEGPTHGRTEQPSRGRGAGRARHAGRIPRMDDEARCTRRRRHA